MKRSVMFILLLLTSGLATAETACDLGVTLLQQDPYPAIPGEYVELVFHIDGTDVPECGDIKFQLIEQYPLRFDPGETGLRTFKKIEYIRDVEGSIQVPYKVVIDEDALDGTNEIEVAVRSGVDAQQIIKLDIAIDDPQVDFEVHVKDYDYVTEELTLEILNIEESDAEALVIEIPKQDNIIVKGSNRVIVGDVDSNEYTTADFEAVPSNGEIKLKLTYSDAINTRRTTEETITFDSSYFTDRAADRKSIGTGTYMFWGVAIIATVWWGYRKFSKKKK